ncbi:MAG: PIG-L deacetylase family protein [Candidatus Levyibacteriota bacterium]
MKKKKTVVCVFAHPDDEAFGPSGTIHKLSKDYDVYILCATKGQAGQDSRSESSESLAARRARELRESAKHIGVKKVYFLGFKDGTLSNNLYHKLADKIRKHLEDLKPELVITFEPQGVSGHIDHITVSMATSFVVLKLNFIKEIWYHCILKARALKRRDYFIYFPSGYKRSEVDKIVDISDVWTIKEKAMLKHESQRHDAERILKEAKGFPKEEYFLVRKLK